MCDFSQSWWTQKTLRGNLFFFGWIFVGWSFRKKSKITPDEKLVRSGLVCGCFGGGESPVWAWGGESLVWASDWLLWLFVTTAVDPFLVFKSFIRHSFHKVPSRMVSIAIVILTILSPYSIKPTQRIHPTNFNRPRVGCGVEAPTSIPYVVKHDHPWHPGRRNKRKAPRKSFPRWQTPDITMWQGGKGGVFGTKHRRGRASVGGLFGDFLGGFLGWFNRSSNLQNQSEFQANLLKESCATRIAPVINGETTRCPMVKPPDVHAVAFSLLQHLPFLPIHRVFFVKNGCISKRMVTWLKYSHFKKNPTS